METQTLLQKIWEALGELAKDHVTAPFNLEIHCSGHALKSLMQEVSIAVNLRTDADACYYTIFGYKACYMEADGCKIEIRFQVCSWDEVKVLCVC